MIVNTKKNVEIEEVSSIVCDKCKKEVEVEDSLAFQEFFKFDFVGGFSSAFGDGTRVKCDLCDSCLKELIGDYIQKGEDT